jgi:hypothetical protein
MSSTWVFCAPDGRRLAWAVLACGLERLINPPRARTGPPADGAAWYVAPGRAKEDVLAAAGGVAYWPPSPHLDAYLGPEGGRLRARYNAAAAGELVARADGIVSGRILEPRGDSAVLLVVACGWLVKIDVDTGEAAVVGGGPRAAAEAMRVLAPPARLADAGGS